MSYILKVKNDTADIFLMLVPASPSVWQKSGYFGEDIKQLPTLSVTLYMAKFK